MEKEALHKSALSFEVAVAPILGLVIPVYRGQTGFSSASINFYEKPMVKTEPTRKRDALQPLLLFVLFPTLKMFMI